MHPRGLTSLWLDRELEPLHDILPADGRFDDLVVGGGLTGLTTALLLARAGRRVGVVEARHIGAVTTGRTTAKLSLLQGTQLSRLRRLQPAHVAREYVDANREGAAWLLRFCDDHDVHYEHRAAVTFASSEDEVDAVRAEHDAASDAGLSTRWVERLDVPFPSFGATVLDDQAQFDPMDVLEALVRQLRLHGGTVHEGRRVVSVSRSGEPEVTLEDGVRLRCEHLVLATGTPILDRGLHFARLEPKRSYALSFQDALPPDGMFLSAGSSSRSVRDARDRSVLIVGGAGHTVGRSGSTERHLDELRTWADRYFPGAKETHAWSAQDYASFDGVPSVGALPLTRGRILAASGYDKWGMTNAVAAAHTISSLVLGSTPPGYHVHPLRPSSVLNAIRINSAVGAAMAGGHVGAARRGSLLPVCTHLGGPLTWNDAEGSWDCRLHGSRFTAEGEVLEGPATRPLRCRGELGGDA